MLNSTALSLTQAVNESTFDAKQWNQAYFFQDDFKATKDLTFNLGLRYEYSTVPFGFFGATDPAIRAVGIPGPVQPDKNNWAPRVGFAYSPSKPTGFLRSVLGEGQTSIRGGFGMAYDVLFYNVLIQTSNNYPRIVNSTISGSSAANLFPTPAPKTTVVPPLNPLTSTFINVPEDAQNPTTNFWTLSVQRQFGTNYILELGYAGVKTYAAFAHGAAFVVALFATDRPELVALIEADHLGRLRTGAASGVAAKYLAHEGAASLGVIGCGWQAETQVSCIRAAVPTIERVVAYCRSERNLLAFCERVGAEPGESHRDAAGQDVVVTITTSRDPVLRGEWLRPGTLVCAVGANNAASRELDNVVLERASLVCCDWLPQARLESADLIEPIQQGVLDWLEVHQLHEVVAGELPGRQSPDDIVVFKSNGIASWDVAIAAMAVERARERKVGTPL